MAKKHYVLDTSALLENPDIINPRHKFKEDACIYLPPVVIRQLDGLKNNVKVANNSRVASKYIEELMDSNKISFSDKYEYVDKLASEADNVIVGTALHMKKTLGEEGQVCLVTTDRNMRIVARHYYNIEVACVEHETEPVWVKKVENSCSGITETEISGKRPAKSDTSLFAIIVGYIVLFFILLTGSYIFCT